MSFRQFDNVYSLPISSVLYRISKIDFDAIVKIEKLYKENGEEYQYISVESETLTDEEIIFALSFPMTSKEVVINSRKNNAIKEAALANQFKSVTSQQAVDYIETNVTNLASAKAVMKIMARMLIALRDAQFPELPDE